MNVAETHIYVIGRNPGPKKVGLASRPKNRLQMLRVGADRDISLLFTRALSKGEAASVEGHAHRILAPLRRRGEWFDASLSAAIQAIEEGVAATLRGERVKASVGQKQINFEQTPGRFPEGTLGRIDAVLKPDEKRADFLREAVESLLKKRERAKLKPEQTP